jgi:uncharacterized protein YigA (DUF484 family)
MTVNAQWLDGDALMADGVEAFLLAHPEFFNQRPALLEALKFPHPCGDAVSLIERQIEVLREKNQRLQLQLNDILQIARENETLHQRIHHLTLTLLDAASVDDALAGLHWAMQDCFQADFAAVRLIRPVTDSAIANLYIPPDSDALTALEGIWESGRPRFGILSLQTARFFFGDDALEIRSHALMPLQRAGLEGFLAIGSRDPERFKEGMGHQFLAQMAEIIAARLVALLLRAP